MNPRIRKIKQLFSSIHADARITDGEKLEIFQIIEGIAAAAVVSQKLKNQQGKNETYTHTKR